MSITSIGMPRCRQMEAREQRRCRAPGKLRRTGRRFCSAGQPVGGAAFHALPVAARSRSSEQFSLCPGTTAPLSFAVEGRKGAPSIPRRTWASCAGRSGPALTCEKPSLCSSIPTKRVWQSTPKRFPDDALQIDAPPAHDTSTVRTFAARMTADQATIDRQDLRDLLRAVSARSARTHLWRQW